MNKGACMSPRPPVPAGSDADTPSFRRLDGQGDVVLIGWRCAGCGGTTYPARNCCPTCFSRDFSPCDLPREGRLNSFTVVHKAMAGYYGPVPYAVGEVAIGPDLIVLSQLAGKSPELWTVGEAVTACAVDMPTDADGRGHLSIHAFRPSDAGKADEATREEPRQ